LGFPKFLALIFVLLWTLYLSLDRLLGRLAGWAIGRTPKAFVWSIECVCVRPSLSWRPHAWSEIIVTDWTWHNPPGFSAGGEPESQYILKIDRLTLRLELASIYRAWQNHEAVQVDMLLLEGVRLRTQRNEEAALNLWEALDLPDSDVNVSAIVQQARRHGGMQKFEKGSKAKRSSLAAVKPLPAVSTEATRKAAKYTRPEWLRRRTERFAPAHTSSSCCCCCPSFTCPPSERSSPSSTPEVHRPYFEYPIGDSRRRPRWGVPLRFDIRQMAVVHVELWIFDLLTMDHRWRMVEPGDTKMSVSSLFISRECLEAGDERRGGRGLRGDSVHGVYLGELIWVLIGQLLPKVIEHSTSNFFKAAAFATGFAIRDSAVTAAAKVLDCFLDAKQSIGQRCGKHIIPSTPSSGHHSIVEVHLIRGRGIAHEGQRVNVHARLELRDPPSRGNPAETQDSDLRQWTVVDTQDSALRIWTKTPWWDQHFSLGPAGSVSSVMRITLFCRKNRHLDTAKQAGKIGEVAIPLQTLLVRDSVIDGQMVGWFPLESTGPSGQSSSRFKGRLKLGLKLKGRRFIPDLVEP